ncbi:MAG TPA: hypothetical protein DCM67_12070 [Propionibacteriaceae bacterium]|nr:hypothetical protein [Propionibacteriaceae bacterium]
MDCTMTDDPFSAFLTKVRDDAEATVTALDATIRQATELDRAIKWGKLTYAVNGDFHHWICATSVSKTTVTVTFHFGGLLADPDHAFRQGSSAFLRMLDFTTPESIDADLVSRMVTAAVERLDYFTAHWKEISSGAMAPSAP